MELSPRSTSGVPHDRNFGVIIGKGEEIFGVIFARWLREYFPIFQLNCCRVVLKSKFYFIKNFCSCIVIMSKHTDILIAPHNCSIKPIDNLVGSDSHLSSFQDNKSDSSKFFFEFLFFSLQNLLSSISLETSRLLVLSDDLVNFEPFALKIKIALHGFLVFYKFY